MNKEFLQEKINEYVFLLKKCNYVTDDNLLEKIKEELKQLKIEYIDIPKGDAQVFKGVLKLCLNNINKSISVKGDYYIDEVLFHEFTHYINSLHKSFDSDESFNICNYFAGRMGGKSKIENLEKNDSTLFDQDPYHGMVLLDEFVAQSIAQKMVIYKYSKLDEKESDKYILPKYLSEYFSRNYTTNICKPPMTIKTSFADYPYPEFYIYAVKFIKKYGYNVDEFIKKTLEDGFTKRFLNSIDTKDFADLYVHLCYLGIIKERVYFLNGHREDLSHDDPAYSATQMHDVMKKTLKF